MFFKEDAVIKYDDRHSRLHLKTSTGALNVKRKGVWNSSAARAFTELIAQEECFPLMYTDNWN